MVCWGIESSLLWCNVKFALGCQDVNGALELHTTYTYAFKLGCVMSHDCLHTLDYKATRLLNEKKCTLTEPRAVHCNR